jgi:hypothetical protein
MKNKLLRNALWGALLAASLLVPRGTLAQIASTGNEINVSYGGYTAVVLQNSPVNPILLSSGGTNEFIINISPNPNVTARVYITNQTANACNNLTISFASSANSQISSFNQFPQDWLQVPIVTSQGAQVNSLPLALAANQSITITTLPIFGNKLVIFLPLSSGCATTNIDMQVILSNSVITTVPLSNPPTSQPVTLPTIDPCLSSAIAKSSAPVPFISAAGTTQIVALIGGQKIYPCALQITQNWGGTNFTYQWEYGTGANCGTGTTTLSGAYPVSNADITTQSIAGPTLLNVPTGNALCIVLVGAASPGGIAGFVSYVQQ